jgi:homoserine dehydrogenase
MPHYNLALLGFGNVGRALAELLERKRGELKDRYEIEFAVSGIATGRHGTAIDPQGIDMEKAVRLVSERKSIAELSTLPEVEDNFDFIRRCQAQVLFENTPVNYETGQPAVDHLEAALKAGMHALTANKGSVVHAHQRLTELGKQNGVKFYHEATVMDGAPIFSLFRETLPGVRLNALYGVLNSTTNLILTRMEDGESLDDAIRYAQSIGIAETDPSGDVDGWDAAVKVSALVTVMMGIPLKPAEVDRQGIRSLTLDDIEQARGEGKRWKLVCSAKREGERVAARVAPEMVPASSPLYGVMGTTSIVQFDTDVLGQLSVLETDPGPETTAYGLLADFINAVRRGE